MKNILKLTGLITLIAFSFFYTEKVIEVIREEDSIMIELKELERKEKIEPINASIVSNTIIPGINGKTINIDKSYKEMKQIGIMNKSLLIYDKVLPTISITNNKDKFIIKGNSKKQSVSLLFILNDNKYLKELQTITTNRNIKINCFLDYNYLINNTTKIKETTNIEFYSYGDKGTYTPDNLLFSNNLITRITNNEANLCLDSTMTKNIIDLCSKNNLYTITPTIILDKSSYKTIKETLSSGNIILIELTKENINSLNTIIDFIEGKGLKIEGLSHLITEELK